MCQSLRKSKATSLSSRRWSPCAQQKEKKREQQKPMRAGGRRRLVKWVTSHRFNPAMRERTGSVSICSHRVSKIDRVCLTCCSHSSFFISSNNSMFFFFIGGVEPTVHKTIQSSVRPCPNCREGNIDLVEVANTFKAFFIPVWTFEDSRRQVLRCNHCGFLMAPQLLMESMSGPSICSSCGSTMQSGWRFCPTCGSMKE